MAEPERKITYITRTDNENDEIEIAIKYKCNYKVMSSGTIIEDAPIIQNFKKTLEDSSVPNIDDKINKAYMTGIGNSLDTKQSDDPKQKIYDVSSLKFYEWKGKFDFLEDFKYPLTIIDSVSEDEKENKDTLFNIIVDISQNISIGPKPGSQATYSPIFIEQT